MAKTVKWPRLSKREAAAVLHVHHCELCGHAFQVRNADCDRAACSPDVCQPCVLREKYWDDVMR